MEGLIRERGMRFSPKMHEKLCAPYVGQCYSVLGVSAPCSRSVPQRKRTFGLILLAAGLCGMVQSCSWMERPRSKYVCDLS